MLVGRHVRYGGAGAVGILGRPHLHDSISMLVSHGVFPGQVILLYRCIMR